MKIAVTSASGQLGSAIVKQLIQEISSDQVIAIARTPEKAKHLGVEVRIGDYNNREDFNSALKGVDIVLLVSGMDDPQKRIQQHRNVIDAAKQNGVKKIVYTSIIGDSENTAFSHVVKSNRQTEEDLKNSGLVWVIGRNGIYIEPDLEFIDTYIKEGEIRNCAQTGKCGYTSRPELAYAYAQMLLHSKHNGKTYNLIGEAITQSELATYINTVYNTDLKYTSVSVEEYKKERQHALGEFIGTIISGIYEGIKNGVNNVPSDYEKAAGRPHKSHIDSIKDYKSNHTTS
ncbi:NmrA family oxireductase [Formosa agariphila KMM 3901]|uniref:NmrA family oxireductase n=1 Tax=Formosa agariphila (strain DSM 15362 / KCTC 12365 / LMG 23005 / KMM 3901 / M-2Alg 35-1) TaxID=1347342 RepID=T2KK02_FORAG|nr:SDR family oxidoreductase [Formosa agariphila]CDF79095.1 NmrA family oxireductase [Formosa agariphila KMM 3901]